MDTGSTKIKINTPLCTHKHIYNVFLVYGRLLDRNSFPTDIMYSWYTVGYWIVIPFPTDIMYSWYTVGYWIVIRFLQI